MYIHTHRHTQKCRERESAHTRSGLNGTPAYVLILMAGPVKMGSYLKKGLYRYNCIKDLEMRSPWIIQLCLKTNDKCHKRKTEGDPRQRRKDRVKTEAEI